jgi:uncharacterized protein YndB with AHSA1/START domain
LSHNRFVHFVFAIITRTSSLRVLLNVTAISEGGIMIEIEATINAQVGVVWEKWNNLSDISQWAHASDDWGAEAKQNDLTPGGRFVYRMFAKDGSSEFEFSGAYDEIREPAQINYTLDDGRKVITKFISTEEGTRVVQAFDPENENPEEMQRQGWQAILNNFKKHVEDSIR